MENAIIATRVSPRFANYLKTNSKMAVTWPGAPRLSVDTCCLRLGFSGAQEAERNRNGKPDRNPRCSVHMHPVIRSEIM
jgi:hypothetical protein